MGRNLFLGSLIFLLLLAGCLGGEQDQAEIRLPEVACQSEDVTAGPPFTLSQSRTAVPDGTFLADQIEAYYGVELIEKVLTNASVFCDLFVMADETAAVELLSRTCTVQMDEAEPPFVGEEVCAREGQGFRMVNFRQGTTVVSILGDSNGIYVDEWAMAVNGRLEQK
jgi:hypothetical protein